ncbi:hypothetical protein COOONC_02089 [Cooperia oncophora]
MKASLLVAAVILGVTLHGIDALTPQEMKICSTCGQLLGLARPFVKMGVIDYNFVEGEMTKICAKYGNLQTVGAACKTLKGEPRILRGWLQGDETTQKLCKDLHLCV